LTEFVRDFEEHLLILNKLNAKIYPKNGRKILFLLPAGFFRYPGQNPAMDRLCIKEGKLSAKGGKEFLLHVAQG
jgi:hypothetical protein